MRFITSSCIGLLRRCIVGSNWSNSSNCGSRCTNCNNFGSNVNANISARLVSDTRQSQSQDFYVAERFFLDAQTSEYTEGDLIG